MSGVSQSFPCPHCDLVQTVADTGVCRRCARPLIVGAESLRASPFERPRPSNAATEVETSDAAEAPSDLLPALDENPFELEEVAPRRRSAPFAPVPFSPPTPMKPHELGLPVADDLAAPRFARAFIDVPSGVIRTWVVVTMVVACVAATLVGRFVRMRAEAISEAQKQMDDER